MRAYLKKNITYIGFTTILLIIAPPVFGESEPLPKLDGWHVEYFWGFSESMSTSLLIHREGESDIGLSATYRGNSFGDSWYYALRFENWTGGEASGIEWVHHKIYLVNNPDKIKDFSVSDGYNLLYFNRAFRLENRLILRGGIGMVFAHPDVTLEGRNRFWMDGGVGGAYLAGASTQFTIGSWAYETKGHFITTEGKITLSYARAPISSNQHEYAEIPNIALHLIFGLGSKPPAKENPEWSDYLIQVFPQVLSHLLSYQIGS